MAYKPTELQKEMMKKLEEGIKKVYDSNEWANYLDLYRNFSNYSWNNKLLVYLQNPNAQIVKGYQAWKNQYGRTVDKGEKAIYICAPSTVVKQFDIEKIMNALENNTDSEFWNKQLEKALENKGIATINDCYFKYIPVFDVSQTSGKELPPHTIREALSEKVTNYDSVLTALSTIAVDNEFASSVTFSNQDKDNGLSNAYGYYRPSTKEIVLRDDMSESMTIKVLVHEMAHSMLHGKEMYVEGIDNTSFISKKDIKEIQAESVAYIVCQELGIDSSKESFGYVAEFANEDMDKLKKNLDVIDKCSKALTVCLTNELTRMSELDKDEYIDKYDPDIAD